MFAKSFLKLRTLLILVFTIALCLLQPASSQHSVVAAPARIPGPALTVDFTAPQYPISPYIYGINWADSDLAADIDLPVQRWGGNAITRYNWENDTTNRASDWYFENIPNDNANPGDLPNGSSSDKFIEQNISTGTETLLTVPTIGWVAKERAIACGFSVAKYGAQQEVDPWQPDCGNGILLNGTEITGNDEEDTSIPVDETFIQEWIQHLISRYGTANSGGVKFYNLDNEPFLWNHTHRDVHPEPLSYDGLRDITYDYAAAIKAVDPNAQILGPGDWGWTAYIYSALDCDDPNNWCTDPIDHINHGSVWFVEWYLQQMQQYEIDNGVRIVDYVDEHFYPQNGVALNENVDPATAELRLRSTRALWDSTYLDESWINDYVQLIPRMHQWVADNYPGTKTALGEYNWGGLTTMNGALAQADILGIFGREQLDLAALWAGPGFNDPGAFAFRMYRNYDGSGSKFGDISVNATSADQADLAIYAAFRSSDGALMLIIINKTGDELTSDVGITGFAALPSAQVYRYSAANLGAIQQLPDQTVSGTGFNATFAAESITLVVLPQGGTSTELLVNGGFEDAGSSNSEAANWTAKNAVKDKRKCNKDKDGDGIPDKIVARTGECSYQLTGNEGVKTSIDQTLSPVGAESGDLLSLGAWINAKNLSSGGKLQAKLIYADSTKEKIKINLDLGTYDYLKIQQTKSLPATVASVKVSFVMKFGGGKYYADDASLKLVEPEGVGLIALPPASDSRLSSSKQ